MHKAYFLLNGTIQFLNKDFTSAIFSNNLKKRLIYDKKSLKVFTNAEPLIKKKVFFIF